MTLEHLIATKLLAAMKARDRARADALRLAKVAISDAQSAVHARTLLGRYRSQCVAEATLYAATGNRGETLLDRLVLDVAVCDELLPPMSREELEALVADIAQRSSGVSIERVIGAVMRVAAGRVEGQLVRSLVSAAMSSSL